MILKRSIMSRTGQLAKVLIRVCKSLLELMYMPPSPKMGREKKSIYSGGMKFYLQNILKGKEV